MDYNKFMKRLWQCILIFIWWLVVPAMAQETTLSTNPIGLEVGIPITGRVDDRNSHEVYYIDGARGEVIQLMLAVTNGTLDPVLSVFDDSGRLIVYRDDTAGTFDIQHSLALPQSGRFYVVIGRFGYSLGATVGEYELRMERTGVLSQQGSTLRYGDSVIDTISDATPQVYYTFQAEQGDLLTISMVRASGTLDPYIQVVSSDRFVIADNDDQIGADTQNARIDMLLIEQTGTYVIVASRYGEVAGDSVGTFALTLDEAQNSGIGNSSLAPLPITYGQTIEARINTQQYERFYTFSARQDDIVTISMRRGAAGRLDSYLILTDDQFVTLIEDDDSGTGQNAQIGTYRIPADGTYYIVTTRYDGKEGTSEGDYVLTLETSGNAFEVIPDGIPTLNYGASITGNINPDNLVDLYAFYANQGDVITISMNRSDGNLDTVVDLLDDAQQLILRDDDGGNGQNSRIERYEIPTTGLYYIRAQRYDGANGDANTTGSYVLVLAQRFD